MYFQYQFDFNGFCTKIISRVITLRIYIGTYDLYDDTVGYFIWFLVRVYPSFIILLRLGFVYLL